MSFKFVTLELMIPIKSLILYIIIPNMSYFKDIQKYKEYINKNLHFTSSNTRFEILLGHGVGQNHLHKVNFYNDG